MAVVPEIIGGAAGLTVLFNTAVTWFDYIYVAKNTGLGLESLLLKLDNSQLRLTRWGEAVGLCDDASKLDDKQDKHARATFELISRLFIKCQEECLDDRNINGKQAADEESPFGPEWKSPMSKYLHEKMQNLVNKRKTKVSGTTRVKFAIYKKGRLEDLVKDINEHIDNLFKVCPPEKEELQRLGEEEFAKFLHVLTTLRAAADHDTLLRTAVNNILNQQSQAVNLAAENVVAAVIGQQTGGSNKVETHFGK